MSRIRCGRRKYYDLFSNVYDTFIRLHSRKDEGGTRNFLVESAECNRTSEPRILDICCGTGSVILSFSEHYPEGLTIGCDFSHGMLREARKKDTNESVHFIEGNAVNLPFADNTFDAVTCSHSLYELKGQDRKNALLEMKRVARPDGTVLIMEHEVPHPPFVKFLFNLRMATMGSEDAHEFVKAGTKPFEALFSKVSLSHTPSGKSKLISCWK